MNRRSRDTGQKASLLIVQWVMVFAAVMLNCCAAEKAASVNVPDYFRANHGYGAGLMEMVDLSPMEGFEAVQSIDELAKFAAAVKGAVGFSVHPSFEKGKRYAHAVIWYTGLTARNQSWPLYLFNEAEARKMPGEAPTPAAAAAAEAKVNAATGKARELFDAARPKGVKLEMEDYQEQKILALAIMRLGGTFEHTGGFTSKACGSCRSVVPGGNPKSCGHGVRGKAHWNCCGGTDPGDTRCRYWELIKALDDKK